MTRYRRAIHIIPVLLLVIGLPWGCYPKRVGPADADGLRLKWVDMTLGQRQVVMEKVILPGAAEIFRKWRPERYGSVDCTLCHGEGSRAGRFVMPTSHLPRLSGSVLLGPEFEKHPETTRLKLDELVPFMAGALGKRSFNIVTRSGFGCYSCHLGPAGPMFGN